MSCSKCSDRGVVLGDSKKLKWVWCECPVGEQLKGVQAPKDRNKYNADPTTRGELKFASKGEALRYDQLCNLERAGEIENLHPHPRYELANEHIEIRYANGRLAIYTADFQYDENGEVVTEDFKSKATMTEASSLRIAVFESLYGRKVRISKK